MTAEERDPAGSFDAGAFLKKLDQSRAEKLEVVARRPKQKRLVKALLRSSEILYALTDTHRKVAALEGGADPVETYEWFPKLGSATTTRRASSDDGRARRRRSIVSELAPNEVTVTFPAVDCTVARFSILACSTITGE